jgi:hypothetical protein
MNRFLPFLIAVAAAFATPAAGLARSPRWLLPGSNLPILSVVGVRNVIQTHHSLNRTLPLADHICWAFEWLRRFPYGYIVDSETEGRPFHIEGRAMVHQPAKDVSSI